MKNIKKEYVFLGFILVAIGIFILSSITVSNEKFDNITDNEAENSKYVLEDYLDIYTKDIYIDYIVDYDYEIFMEDIFKLDMPYVYHDEVIRISVPRQVEHLGIEKNLIWKDGTVLGENLGLVRQWNALDSDNFQYDLENIYKLEQDLQAVVYKLQFLFADGDKETINCSFGVKTVEYNSNPNINADVEAEDLEQDVENKEDETTETIEGYLSKDEQETYNQYKNGEIDLIDAEPLEVAKFYVQSMLEKDYKLTYSFLTGHIQFQKPSEDEFIANFSEVRANELETFIENLKAVENGEFVSISEDYGYIQYEVVDDHPLALEVTKVDGIWYVAYFGTIS